jgi:hypothetical protein
VQLRVHGLQFTASTDWEIATENCELLYRLQWNAREFKSFLTGLASHKKD